MHDGSLMQLMNRINALFACEFLFNVPNHSVWVLAAKGVEGERISYLPDDNSTSPLLLITFVGQQLGPPPYHPPISVECNEY
jgi:hypothetical protein